MKITKKELEEKLQGKLSVHDLIKLIYYKYDDDDILVERELVTEEEASKEDYDPIEWLKANICDFKLVHNKRDSDGDHDGYTVVVRFGEDLFLMINGYYSSENGVDFDYTEVYHVREVEKIIKVWETINEN